MATIEQTSDTGMRPRLLLLALGLLAVGAVVILIVLFRRPPQMGADEKVFNTVDALFTAVRARDAKLLGQCEQRLHALRDAGKLPPEAARYLDDVVGRARDGRWESAAEQLYDFMKQQRREGADKPSQPKHKHRGATR